MSTIWVREFTGGLDTRRMPETTPGGSLIDLRDAHITRGGEIEKRAALVPVYELPTGATKGLSHTRTSILVFGDDETAATPPGVAYQQLEHPTGQLLAAVPSTDLFSGKVYAAAQYADGSVFHFYDGARVEDWYDGRARAAFTVSGATGSAAVAAHGSFTITGGTVGAGNQVTNVTVNGIPIISGAVAFTTDAATTAAAVASAINTYTSSPEYTASAAGPLVTITASAAGAAANGLVVAVTPGGSVTVGGINNMAGGADAVTPRIADITVNGVSVIGAPVLWATSNSATATAIASAIQSFASAPEYDATAVGTQVNIIAATAGTGPNGYTVTITALDGLVVTPATGLALAGGADTTGTFTPGTFVRTFQTKMYATSGSYLHFSGVAAPSKWTTDTAGAGFIDMSSQTSGSDQLRAVAPYQGKLAVFAEETVVIEYVDPDPTNNVLSQVLNNTGVVSGNSVTQFGDSDLFYCAQTGLRSLRARDASNAAATTDIGVPVDTLIIAKLRGMTELERLQIIGLIEPTEGRFWLIIKDTIFVFSYFPGAKVSAWSVYNPGFDVEYATVFKRRVYLRSGDTIYVYGGLGDEPEYDATQAVARLPFLDGDKPWQEKTWKGLDAAISGEWEVRFSMEPTLADANDKVAILEETTFNKFTMPAAGASTHISLLFTSLNDGYARIGSIAVHYDTAKNDDDRARA